MSYNQICGLLFLFSFVTNNCMHAVDAALDATGLWHIDPGSTGILGDTLMVYNGIVYGLNSLGCSFDEASFSIPVAFYPYNLLGSSASYLNYNDFKMGFLSKMQVKILPLKRRMKIKLVFSCALYFLLLIILYLLLTIGISMKKKESL